MSIIRTINNTRILLTNDQNAALDAITSAKAGFVGIKGYKATSGMITPKVSDVTLNIKPKYETIKANRLRELENIKLEDLDLSDWVPNKGKGACATAAEQFEQVYNEELAKARGETRGSESHAAAHDDNSVSYEGAKIWLETPNADGVRPVKSINVFALPVQEKIIERGERKKVNSGSRVLMRNAIMRLWNKRSCAVKTYTLGDPDKHGEVNGMPLIMG